MTSSAELAEADKKLCEYIVSDILVDLMPCMSFFAALQIVRDRQVLGAQSVCWTSTSNRYSGKRPPSSRK
ncbi:hypothetical protein CDAR_110281 [Caerostris darwini]|uniref:Uncharacterized protein n=1 Tax=Caerostris darwini TaxID=1538125 RepID=A0AAV4UB24_9ARAC|nr:hypothetical protein CDAR_110281 [Caerostris darwini]